MKKFLFKLVILVSIILIFFIIFTSYIIFCIPQQFNDEYQSAINRKYEYLLNTNEPKIVYVSGSSGTFCIDDKYVANELKRPFINLGLHASYGIRFISELSKASINKDDIIILGFEESVYADSIEKSDIYLIASGINDNSKLFKYLSYKQKLDFMSYLPTYLFKKLDRYHEHYITPDGIYNSKHFDELGIFNYNREELDPNLQTINEIPGLNEFYINKSIIEYFKKYNEFAKNKGAQIYIVFPPISENSVVSTNEEHNKFKETLETKTGIKVINNIEQVLFQNKFLYDFNYHCNNNGQKIYSELLVNAIKKQMEENN